MTTVKLDTFSAAYLECALWASTDDNGAPLDSAYSLEDIAPEALASMLADCERFAAAHAGDIADNPARAGHDYWLTRNGHGAGFWDGEWPEDIGQRLTTAAHADGECNLYPGDDGRLYVL